MIVGVVWPQFSEGDHANNWRARDLNFLVDQVRRLSNVSTGPGLAVEHTRSGVHLTTRADAAAAAVAGAAAAGLAFFRVVVEGTVFQLHNHPDTMLANIRTADGWSEELTKIAKPYGLRGTPFDGKTIEKRWVEPEGLTGVMTTRQFTYEYTTGYMVRRSTRDDGSINTESVTPGWYHDEVIVCARGPTMIEDVVWTDTTHRNWAQEL